MDSAMIPTLEAHPETAIDFIFDDMRRGVLRANPCTDDAMAEGCLAHGNPYGYFTSRVEQFLGQHPANASLLRGILSDLSYQICHIDSDWEAYQALHQAATPALIDERGRAAYALIYDGVKACFQA